LKDAKNHTAKGVKWDLSDLYSGPDDPEIQSSVEKCLKSASLFEKKYRNSVSCSKLSAAEFLKILKKLESISESAAKVYSYAQLLHASNTGDPKAGALLQYVREKYAEIKAHLLIFYIESLKMPEKKAKTYIENKKLTRYRHTLKTRPSRKPHILGK